MNTIEKAIYTADRVLTDRFRIWWRRRHGIYTIGRWKYPWRSS
jgi:hypothetical protein